MIYLEKEGVNHIRRLPYLPQSQGAVKAFNKSILKFLNLAYDESNDIFELNRAITHFLLYYNEENIPLQSIHHIK